MESRADPSPAPTGLRGQPLEAHHDHPAATDVYKQHAQAMIAGDLEDIVADYADNALFITPEGVLHGQGVREGFTKLFGELPDPRFDVRTRILEGDVLFLEWSATADGSHADDGVETFLVRDGAIVHYTASNEVH